MSIAAPTAHAQSEVFYYAGMTEQENADVRAWSVLYWQRVGQGGGNPGAGFSFDTPIMNSQLFNPLRSARITLDSISSGSTNYCDRMNELPATGELDFQTLEHRAAIKDLMLFGEIATYQGTPEEWMHELLIFAAPPDYPYLVFDENGVLISVDLPLAEVSGVAADAALALKVSPQTEQIIATLIGAGGLWANQCTNVPMWKALITNETSTTEQFKAKVDAYLAMQTDPVALTQIIYANFGVFGELPVVSVSLTDAYILMDPTNGNLSGPFEPGSPLDARGLLGQHQDVYQANTAVEYFSDRGCPTTIAGIWLPGPFPSGSGWGPITTIPGGWGWFVGLGGGWSGWNVITLPGPCAVGRTCQCIGVSTRNMGHTMTATCIPFTTICWTFPECFGIEMQTCHWTSLTGSCGAGPPGGATCGTSRIIETLSPISLPPCAVR